MSKARDEQLKQWAEEFRTYSDVLDTPGWRKLVEEPLIREMDWVKVELSQTVISGAGIDSQTLIELKAYYRALEFVFNQIMHRRQLGEQSNRTLRERAVELGKGALTVVPKFQEVR